MIKVEICHEGHSFSVTAHGHAGFAPAGQDILCAAVSTLLYALGSYISEADRKRLTKDTPLIQLEKGTARVKVVPDICQREKMQGVFELTRCFLALLEKNYPENIKLAVRSRRETENEQ